LQDKQSTLFRPKGLFWLRIPCKRACTLCVSKWDPYPNHFAALHWPRSKEHLLNYAYLGKKGDISRIEVMFARKTAQRSSCDPIRLGHTGSFVRYFVQT